MKPTIYAPFLSLVALAACDSLSSPINNQPPTPTFTVIRAQGDSAALAGRQLECAELPARHERPA